MDALLMCGGHGRRLGTDTEKPLVEIDGQPMVERVHAALTASRVDDVYAVSSPATPETAARVACPTIETPGHGYVPDLKRALADGRLERPVLTVAADLPLLEAETVDAVLTAADGSLTAVVPVGRKRALGLSVDTAFRHGGTLVTPAGLNIVDTGEDTVWVTRDRRLAVNVNHPEDARRAAWAAVK